jgi:ParB/RepB/Spo0J family partition protein
MSTAELTMTQDQIMDIPLNQLHADEEFNSRGPIDPFEIRELIESIASKGLLQPIAVYPYNDNERKKYNKKYKIILGYCRYAAHQALKKEVITCIVKPWMDVTTARVLNLTENIRRKDLNILQEAKSLENFKNAGWTMEMVAKQLNVSRSWVQNR